MTNHHQRRVNKQARYSNIRWFNDRCAQALHEATEKWTESQGCTLKTGGDQIFISRNMNHAAELRIKEKTREKKRNDEMLKRISSQVNSPSKIGMRSLGNKENG